MSKRNRLPSTLLMRNLAAMGVVSLLFLGLCRPCAADNAASTNTPAQTSAPSSGTLNIIGTTSSNTTSLSGTLTISGMPANIPISGTISNGGTSTTATGTVTIANPTLPIALSPALSRYFDLEIGMIVLQSYSINTTTHTLQSGGTQARGMAQMELKNRYAWRNTDDGSVTNRSEGTNTAVGLMGVFDNGSPNVKDLAHWTGDFEAQAGFAFGGSSSGSSAATGAGDAFAQASLALNIFKERGAHALGEQPFINTVNLEGFGGFVTDSGVSLVHPNGGIGLSYVAGIPLTGKPPIEFMFRSGIAWIDSPQISSSTGLVATNADGTPKFSMEPGIPFTIEAHIPLNIGSSSATSSNAAEYGYLSLGGTFYRMIHDNPDPWSMSISYSISPEGLFQAISKVFGPINKAL